MRSRRDLACVEGIPFLRPTVYRTLLLEVKSSAQPGFPPRLLLRPSGDHR